MRDARIRSGFGLARNNVKPNVRIVCTYLIELIKTLACKVCHDFGMVRTSFWNTTNCNTVGSIVVVRKVNKTKKFVHEYVDS